VGPRAVFIMNSQSDGDLSTVHLMFCRDNAIFLNLQVSR
jgi:hypothetical protein